LWDGAAIVALALVPLASLWSWRRVDSRALRWLIAVVAAHAALFLAVYVASGFTVGTVMHSFYLHRLTPLWFLGVLLVALGASRARWLRIAVLALAAMGALDTLRLLRDANPRDWGAHLAQLASTKGYRYSQYLQKIAPRLSGTRAQKLAVLLEFRERDPEALHEALAIALYGEGAGSFETMCAEIRGAGVDDLGGFYRGMGLMLMRHHGLEFEKRIAVVMPFPPEIREPLLEGIGRFGAWEFGRVDTVLDEAWLGVERQFPDAFFVGLGRRLWEALGDARVAHYFERRSGPVALDRESAALLLLEFPEPVRASIARGYEAALAAQKLD